MKTSNVRSASRLPELQQTVLAVGADEVLVGVVSDADHVLLVDLQEGRDTRDKAESHGYG